MRLTKRTLTLTATICAVATGAVVSSISWAAVIALRVRPATACESYNCSDPGFCPSGCTCPTGISQCAYTC
jgi:hypothetical protein